MTAINIKSFNGLKPIVSTKLLEQNEAQVANNVRLISGALVPLKAATTLKAALATNPKTIFPYEGTSGEDATWLEFTQDTDIIRSPIANDQYRRLYWTNGSGVPRYAPNSLILQAGTGPYPRASYELGIPKPASKAVITAYSTPPVYTLVTREYVLTLYNPTTTKESLPSAVISVQGVDGQKVSFTGLTTDNQGDAGITKKRIYRKVSGTYRRVVELDLSVTSYDDTATDASLGSAATLSGTVGLSTPTRAPTLTVSGSTTSPTAIQRDYVYTVKTVTATFGSGENAYQTIFNESAPSAVKSVTADNTQTVTLTGFANTVSNVSTQSGTAYRIYRKDAGQSTYNFIAEIPVGQTSYADNLATSNPSIPLNYDAYSTYAATGTLATSLSGSTAGGQYTRVYMVTWVDGSGNESGKSPSSATVTVVDGQTTVNILHTETIPSGVVKKRLYRQNVTVSSGSITLNDANWKRVTESTASTTSFTDVAQDSTLTLGFSASLQNIPPTPTATAGVQATVPPTIVPEARTYVFTYVSAYGEEGPPSDASDVQSLDPNQSVTVSLPGGAPAGAYNITLKRIYRSSTVGSQAQFQFVAEVPVANTTYTDTKKQADLGEVLPSEDWVGPVAGLQGLRMMANGSAAGFNGRTLYLSEPNLPHAWPNSYNIDDDIVGIATYGQTVAVLTTGYPRLFQGIDPAAMSETKLEVPQACVSKRSIVQLGDGALYASADGLVSINAMTADVVTKNLISRQQWQAYNPSSMEAYVYNGRVHIIYDNGTKGILILDFSGQGAIFTTSDVNSSQQITAGYYDPRADILYFHQGGSIKRFDAGSPLTFVWKSKVYRMQMPMNFSCAQVFAEQYPITFKLYVSGDLKMTKTVTDNNLFRLPSGFRAYDWEIQLEGSGEVYGFDVATSALELRVGP